MKNKPVIFKKILAVFTTVIFLSTAAFNNFVYTYALPSMQPAANTVVIPASLGKITSAKYFDSKDIVISIQDLHCHAETQKKITSIIEHIDSICGLDKVYLEGAFQNINTSWLSSFKETKEGSMILESLVNTGNLSGTEYYSVIKNKNNFIAGIEDRQLYEENIKLLAEIIAFKPEIEALCGELEKEIKNIRKDYTGRQARYLDKKINEFQNKKITAKEFYNKLKKLADNLRVPLTKYPYVRDYIKFLNNTDIYNAKKALAEFKIFESVLKKELPYKEYYSLLKQSNNFSNIEDISENLINYNIRFDITTKLKLKNLDKFFSYLEFGKKINPILLLQESDIFINDLYMKSGRTKYEKEAAFLSEFVPTIKKYFTADIPAEEYSSFESNYKKFKFISTSYFPGNSLKKLEKYRQLLSQYHNNNIKRDKIFADIIVPENNALNSIEIKDTDIAAEHIKANFLNKNIKLVVTGGFHTRGLEKIFENRKVSYIVVTPNITQSAENAKQIYTDNVTNYSKILKTTINLEPLTQEAVNISFPKILNSIFILVKNDLFENFSEEQIKSGIKSFVKEYIVEKQPGFDKETEIAGWDITSFDLKNEEIKFFVTYKTKTSEGKTVTVNYSYSNGSITDDAKPEEKTISAEQADEPLLSEYEPLTIFSLKKAGERIKLVYDVIFAPAAEEFFFRVLPFVFTGMMITSPVSVIPVTAVYSTGVFGFSAAHELADRITKQKEIRDWKSFIKPSFVLTGVYAGLSLAFPGTPWLAFAVTTVLHSLNNYFAVYSLSGILNKVSSLSRLVPLQLIRSENNELKHLDQEQPVDFKSMIDGLLLGLQRTGDKLADDMNYYSHSRDYEEKVRNILNELMKIKKSLIELKKIQEFTDEDKNKILSEVEKLFGVSKNIGLDFAVNMPFGVMLQAIVLLSDENSGISFDTVLDFVLETGQKKYFDTYFKDLMSSAQKLYNMGKKECFYKIFEGLYKNKSLYKTEIPIIPSPSSFTDNKQWAKNLLRTIKETSGTDVKMYVSYIDMFMSLNDDTGREYAAILMKALYETGKVTTPPVISSRKQSYEWFREYYRLIGKRQDICLPQDNKFLIDRKYFESVGLNPDRLSEYNITLSDVISRLYYLNELFKEKSGLLPEGFYSVIDNLKKEMSSPKNRQLKVLEVQMNELMQILTESNMLKGEVIKTLFPVMSCVRSSENKTLSIISAILRHNPDMLSDISNADYMYVDKETALVLLKKFVSGKKFISRTPRSLQEASDFIHGLLREYEDLERFYAEIGVPFDSIEKKSVLYDRMIYYPEYELLFEKIRGFFALSGEKPAAKYFRSLKKDKQAEHSAEGLIKISEVFDAFNSILENNAFSLSELNKDNEEALEDSIYFVEEMIKSLRFYAPDTAAKFEISLETVKNNLRTKKMTMAEGKRLHKWSEGRLDQIEELHTLINAVHQMSIKLFQKYVKQSIASDFSGILPGTQYMFKENETEYFDFYDCSDGDISRKMQEFISELTIDDISTDSIAVSKDNKLIYSKRLGVHSADIFVDLDEGIRVSFNESDSADGNALRVKLLTSLFARAGFDIIEMKADSGEKLDFCRFTAFCSLPKSVESVRHYASLFIAAVTIISNTLDLDYALENNSPDYDRRYYGRFYIPDLTLADLKRMKNSPSMPANFEKNGNLYREWVKRSTRLDEVAEKKKNQESRFDRIYDYLNIPTEDRNPWTILKLYVEGKLILRDGKLEINNDYDGITDLLKAIDADTDETLRQAQLINMLDAEDLNFETEGYIGGMIVLNGVVRLNNEGWLSVKAAVDKGRKRAQCAYVEFVDFNGNRKKLAYNELIAKLQKAGYKVNRQNERSESEKIRIINILKEKIYFPKDGIYMRGRGVSYSGNGYVPAKITYKKANTDSQSMWITSYTTPEDVETILKAKGLLTTSGGMLSHANITAKENGKTAILSNGIWKGGRLEMLYYVMESGIEDRENGYQIQKISEHRIVLEEGDVILANGDNGRMLLYDKISKEELQAIQKAIDKNDAETLKEYINRHKDDENNQIIRQIAEYIFMQVADDITKTDIIKLLLSYDKNSEVGKKISELKHVHISEKIKKIKQIFENEKQTNDVNKKYALMVTLTEEIKTIKHFISGAEEETEELLKAIDKEKQKVIAAVSKEVQEIKEKVEELLMKEDLTAEETDALVKIRERMKVWNCYRDDEIRALAAKIDDKLHVSAEESTEYFQEIKGFESISSRDIPRYGRKTVELAKMSKLFSNKTNARVPYGIGVGRNVLQIFMTKTGSLKEYLSLIEDLKKAIDSGNRQAAFDAAEKICMLIDKCDDEQLRELIGSKLDPGKRYAVRSSGVGEDGEMHAFAGMAKTKLNVVNEDVYGSIKECWKSFYSPTCIEDMMKEKILIEPALLIQKMVRNVQKAGVSFSSDNNGNLTEEIVWGLGEGLVSGRIAPDHISINSSDGRIEYTRALNNMTKILEKEGGGTIITKLTREEKVERIADEELIRKIYYAVTLLEDDAGYPVDIEFAVDGSGELYILQRRPVTTFSKYDVDLSLTEENYSRIKHNISVVSGDVSQYTEYFVCLSNPLNPEEAIPVYMKEKGRNNTEFIVDERYAGLIDNDVLGNMLLARINDDPAVLARFNGPFFYYKKGEIGMLPPGGNYNIDGMIINENSMKNNIRSLLASA